MQFFEDSIPQSIQQDASNFRGEIIKDIEIARDYALEKREDTDGIKFFDFSVVKEIIDEHASDAKTSLFIESVTSILNEINEGREISDCIKEIQNFDERLKIKNGWIFKNQQFRQGLLKQITAEHAQFMTPYQVFTYLDEKDPNFEKITQTMVNKIRESSELGEIFGDQLQSKVSDEEEICDAMSNLSLSQ